ncbi:tetraspanin-11 [Strongylocentrotus purpuratus]|uniref:Tetraspanin n=1 Tax=Strongylocentrotus purpuratus TaxID=7668 RepID=A0A7M7RFG7_STRPU|nr:tetraspanin-11 [Strongylocentrotus purpuratus]XP_798693.2 tetraspanin-11 [Strongylocentrotus purpuratus]
MGDLKKKLSWGGNFCRGILCFFNFFFLLGGVILMALGIWVLVDSDSKHLTAILTDNLHHTAAYILLIAGVFVMIVSIFGFCGAKMENKCCLGMYVFFLVIIFIIELAAGCIALYFYVKTDVVKDLNRTLTNNYGGEDGGDVAITNSWDFIQSSFECCGVMGNASSAVTLYEKSTWYKNQTDSPKNIVPASCCMDQDSLAACQQATSNYAMYIYKQGCSEGVKNKVAQYGTVLGGVGIVVAIIQLMGMACALCLCKRL